MSQLFPNSSEKTEQPDLIDNSPTTKRWDENVMNMRSLINQHKLLPSGTESNRGIVNVFTNKKATVEQAHDLLQARDLGEEYYKDYITHHIIQSPSVKAPLRRKRLLTMAPTKVTKTKMSQKEKEERDTNKYLRRRLAWCNRMGQTYDEGTEQYSVLPIEADGIPNKGAKSKWTDKLQARYSESSTTPFVPVQPWVALVVIVDAMFAINTNPLRQHKTVEQHAYLLFKQYAVPQFCHGTQQVHFVFNRTIQAGTNSILRIVNTNDMVHLTLKTLTFN